jgi:hypothetical protein
MRITAGAGVLRRVEGDRWEVRLTFEVCSPGGTLETWTGGGGWTLLGARPASLGFNGLELAGEAALSDIEADIERLGYRPERAFSRIAWSGDDCAAERMLEALGEGSR